MCEYLYYRKGETMTQSADTRRLNHGHKNLRLLEKQTTECSLHFSPRSVFGPNLPLSISTGWAVKVSTFQASLNVLID